MTKNQIKMTPGKMYIVSGQITLLPDIYFSFNRNDVNCNDFSHLIVLDSNSKPNVFLFMKHIYDTTNTMYSFVLYKSKFYITQNEYHIGNSIIELH